MLEEYQLLVSQGNGGQITIGFQRSVGKGSLTVLGVPPSPELVTALHDHFGIAMPAKPETAGVQAALYRAADCRYLIVLNNGMESKAAQIQLSKEEFPNGIYDLKDLLDHQERRIRFEDATPRMISVQLEKKNGVLLEIRPVVG